MEEYRERVGVADPIRVRVTQEHIDNGIRADDSSCPITLAAIDNGFSAPRTTKQFLVLEGDDEDDFAVYHLGEDGERFVEDYDEGREVAPVTFVFHPHLNPEPWEYEI